MQCEQCRLTGVHVEMEVHDLPGQADPETGDVWSVKAWACPHCDHWEEYTNDSEE